jgi:hypothetical protein
MTAELRELRFLLGCNCTSMPLKMRENCALDAPLHKAPFVGRARVRRMTHEKHYPQRGALLTAGANI